MTIIPDSEGVNILPQIVEAAKLHGISPEVVLGTLMAESNLRRVAERYGVWPDVSFGMCQMTVATARMYGIGDGTNTPGNIELVKGKLFDRDIAIGVCAAHLERCQRVAKKHGKGTDIETMVVYNAGHLPEREGGWWTRYAGHVKRYQACLERAKIMLKDVS